ncbi:MAG: ATP-dependent DNA ligase [Planctomycetota bacterium]
MKNFAQLYQRLDGTTKTNEKVDAMVDYFAAVNALDAAWATYFLSGNKIRRLVATKDLRVWAATQAGIPDWLFDESYHAVGDLAETMSLIVPPGSSGNDDSLADWVQHRLLPLRGMDDAETRSAVLKIWNDTASPVRLVVMKLITGAFRVGVSKRLVTRAIAKHAGIPVDVAAHRLMGDWEPSEDFFRRVIHPEAQDTRTSQPYPFCLAHSIDRETGPQPLGEPGEYLVEWKWDGIRGQVIRRQGQTFIWSRGEELMENRWPEIESAAETLPDGTVIDGEILAATDSHNVLPFAQLQRRIGRKTIGKKLLGEVPVRFFAFDVLEHAGQDVRGDTMADRRALLERIVTTADHPNLALTERIETESWEQLAGIRGQSRERHSEGLMLKKLSGVYDVGRVRGNWWKWKVDPFTIDAVLIYAQKGHGKRASLFTDYTFALWRDDELVPVAKAYSGLDDAEIRKVDRFVRDHTQDSFGPVRSVDAELVMEIAFEGLQRSTRHKSGIATRFPRILRWRHDKQAKDANTLADLLALLPPESA